VAVSKLQLAGFAFLFLVLDLTMFFYVDSRNDEETGFGGSKISDYTDIETVSANLETEKIGKPARRDEFLEKVYVDEKRFQINDKVADPLVRMSNETEGEVSSPGNVIVLSFHDLSIKKISPSIITTVDSFIEMLKALKKNNYQTFFARDIASLMSGKAMVKKGCKPVILTFDDGYKNNYALLFPLIKKYRVKVTFFLITGKLKEFRSSQTDNSLTFSEVQEMVDSGLVELGSHTHYNHKNLVSFLKEEKTIKGKRRRLWGIYKDLLASDRVLKEKFSIDPVSLAWPHGKEDRHLIYAAKKAGFKFVFNTRFGVNSCEKKEYFRLRRISASSSWLSAQELIKRMDSCSKG